MHYSFSSGSLLSYLLSLLFISLRVSANITEERFTVTSFVDPWKGSPVLHQLNVTVPDDCMLHCLAHSECRDVRLKSCTEKMHMCALLGSNSVDPTPSDGFVVEENIYYCEGPFTDPVNNGTYFDDKDLVVFGPITVVNGKSGYLLDSLQITYGNHVGPRHGLTKHPTDIGFTVDEDDAIIKVDGHLYNGNGVGYAGAPTWVHFYTRKGHKYGPFGDRGLSYNGQYFEASGGRLRTITGTSRSNIVPALGSLTFVFDEPC